MAVKTVSDKRELFSNPCRKQFTHLISRNIGRSPRPEAFVSRRVTSPLRFGKKGSKGLANISLVGDED